MMNTIFRATIIALLVFFSASYVFAAPYQYDRGQLGRKLPIFPKSNPPAMHLLHVDLTKAPDEERFALTVLQGLVNRIQPRIYINQNPGWYRNMIPVWTDRLKAHGYSFEDIADPMSLASRFRDVIAGAVIYEPDLKQNPESLHKLNAVTLYCAINNAIPLTEEMNTRLKLPVILDVRGKYNNAEEAYEWAYKELWPHANHNLMAFTCPTHIVLRDYLVENKIMPIWISRGMDNRSQEICFDMIDEAAPNSPVMGCWGGFKETPEGSIDEPNLQRILSTRGKFAVVTDGCCNLSVHSGFLYSKPQSTNSPAHLKLDLSKTYVCFNFTDGDNIMYLQMDFDTKQWWQDPSRGKVPIGWSISPDTAELMPDVMEYFQSTLTANDELVGSTSGLGTVPPSLYGKGRYSNYEALYNEYMALTWKSMLNTGLKSIHLGDTSLVPWTHADFDRWARNTPKLDGILGDYGYAPWLNRSNAASILSNNVPLARTLTYSPNQNGGASLGTTGATWVFEGCGGIQANASRWGADIAPSGVQTALLQALGSMSQQVYFPDTGTYRIKFEAAQREGYPVQSIQLGIDGMNIGSPLTPTDRSFKQMMSVPFTVSTVGEHNIEFRGRQTLDSAAFIDDVSIISESGHAVAVANSSFETPSQPAEGKDRTEEWVDRIHNITPPERPAFLHVSAICWLDSPTTITNIVKALGPDYVPVLPSQLFDLMRQNQNRLDSKKK